MDTFLTHVPLFSLIFLSLLMLFPLPTVSTPTPAIPCEPLTLFLKMSLLWMLANSFPWLPFNRTNCFLHYSGSIYSINSQLILSTCCWPGVVPGCSDMKMENILFLPCWMLGQWTAAPQAGFGGPGPSCGALLTPLYFTLCGREKKRAWSRHACFWKPCVRSDTYCVFYFLVVKTSHRATPDCKDSDTCGLAGCPGGSTVPGHG